MKIGQNLKNKRLSLNMSQDELAEKLFVTRQTISNYEVGKSQPSIDTLVKLSEVFQCELDELLDRNVKSNKQKKVNQTLICIGACVFAFLLLEFYLIPLDREWMAINYEFLGFYFLAHRFFYPTILGSFLYYLMVLARRLAMKCIFSMDKIKYLRRILWVIVTVYIIGMLIPFFTYLYSAISNTFYPSYMKSWNLMTIVFYGVNHLAVLLGVSHPSFLYLFILAVLIGGFLGYTKEIIYD